MSIFIGSDHAGFELKEQVKQVLAERGLEFSDVGTDGPESVDYPDFAALVARAVSEGRAKRGILICGTGIGMSIVANKFPGVRAGLVSDPYTARMCREHNDCNVLVLAARVGDLHAVPELVHAWLDTPFGGDRHARRVEKIRAVEAAIGAAGCTTT